MNKRELAKTLGVSLSTVDKWLLKPDFPARKVGKEYDFKLDEVQEWLKGRQKKFEPISDVPIVPATLVGSLTVFCFANFLVSKGKLKPEEVEGLITEFLNEKPEELFELEDVVNDTFKLLESKRRFYE